MAGKVNSLFVPILVPLLNSRRLNGGRKGWASKPAPQKWDCSGSATGECHDTNRSRAVCEHWLLCTAPTDTMLTNTELNSVLGYS